MMIQIFINHCQNTIICSYYWLLGHNKCVS